MCSASLRPLVPYFVPGSHDVNDSMKPEKKTMQTTTATTVHVREWDRTTGVFVDAKPVMVGGGDGRRDGKIAREGSDRGTPVRVHELPSRYTPPKASPIPMRLSSPFARAVVGTPASAPSHAVGALLTPAAICARRAQRTASAPSSPQSSAKRVAAREQLVFTPPPSPPRAVRSTVASPPVTAGVGMAQMTVKTKQKSPPAKRTCKFAGSSFEGMAPPVHSIKIPRAAAAAALATEAHADARERPRALKA